MQIIRGGSGSSYGGGYGGGSGSGGLSSPPTPMFFDVNGGATDVILVPAVAGKKIIVIQLAFVCGATDTNVVFNSYNSTGPVSTTISCTFQNAGNGGIVLPLSSTGWFETNTGEALSISTVGATCGILLSYTLA